jgi:hypothetical protein
MNDHEHDELIERVSRALDVPEPSPLFWDHFPGRVRMAVHAAPAPSRFAWLKTRATMLAVSTAAVAIIATATMIRTRPAPTGGPQPAVAQETIAAAPEAPYQMEALEADAGWDVVTEVAASAGSEVLHEAGFGVAPGASEPAIEALSEAERKQFMALLHAEMKGDD